MKTKQIVYHADGENAGTYGPLCFLENFTGNLDEKVWRFYSHDFDQQIEVERYRVYNLNIPDWMTEPDFVRHHVKLKYAIGLGGEVVLGFSEDAFFRFCTLNERQQYWYQWAREKNRGQFVASLLQQFNNWLQGVTKHPNPLSQRQWEYAMRYCPRYEAGYISASLYGNRTPI